MLYCVHDELLAEAVGIVEDARVAPEEDHLYCCVCVVLSVWWVSCLHPTQSSIDGLDEKGGKYVKRKSV